MCCACMVVIMVLSAADVLRLHRMRRFLNGEQRKGLFGGAFEAEAPRVNRRRSAHVTLAQMRLFENELNFSGYLGVVCPRCLS